MLGSFELGMQVARQLYSRPVSRRISRDHNDLHSVISCLYSSALYRKLQ